jgi:hypothetical protein
MDDESKPLDGSLRTLSPFVHGLGKAILQDVSVEIESLRAQLAVRVPEALPTDEELTVIYKIANGEDTGKAQPLTTQRIFKAMRAMLSAAPSEH